MTKKLRDGFSLIELMVALAISTTILTLAFLTYGKIYTDSAKLEKYLKDELDFQNDFAEFYREFQSSGSLPVIPAGITVTSSSVASPNPCPPSASYSVSKDYSLSCHTYTITKQYGSDEHTAYIYKRFR